MVEVERIKTAVADREDELRQKFEKERIIQREGESDVKKLVSTDAALVITGVRRCGKSLLAFMLGKDEKYGYVNFEDERLLIDAGELNRVLEALYSLKGDVDFLIFDEIQNIKGWENFVARIVPNKKVIITGSNAKLLSRELATHLTGRHVDFTLFPFSFREFLAWKNFKPNVDLTKNRAKTKDYLAEYLEKGGFPLTHKLGMVFLAENYKDIIERDILQRYKIKYERAFKELARYLISNASGEISYNRLKSALNIKSVHTVKNYISYLENAYLIFELERFSFKLKEQMLAPKKIYCIDTGFVNVIGFEFSTNRGKYAENAVAVELLRQGTFSMSNKKQEVYYWKDHQQREVDFIIKEGRKVKQLIQVTCVSSKKEINKRETDALLRAGKELDCRDLLVITWDYEGESKEEGRRTIQYMPLWKWLLSRGPQGVHKRTSTPSTQ